MMGAIADQPFDVTGHGPEGITLRNAAERDLTDRNKKSYEAYVRAKQYIPAGVMSRARLFSPYPFYIKEGRGSKVIDLDDHEIIDCAMGYGPLMLGHAHPVITEAMMKWINKGTQFGIPHEEEYKLAKLMVDTVSGLEKISFCNSGTEAIYQALRICRAATGKMKFAKFEGGYHGGANEVMFNFKYNREKGGPVEAPNPVPASIGIAPEMADYVIVLPYNHEAAFNILAKHKDELAVVMIEVVQGMGGMVPGKPAFMKKLRQVTKELSIHLLVDEIITGYRLGLSGGQGYYGIEADIATYGKIMGGGLPIGGVGGKDSLMELIAYTGDLAIDVATKPFYGGTFNGNPITMAAGVAMIQYLKDHPEIYTDLERLGKKLRDGVNAFAEKEGIPAKMHGVGSMFCTHFMAEPYTSVRDFVNENMKASAVFYPYLLLEGVFIPNHHMGFISAAHSEEDIEMIIKAHCNALKKTREEGVL